MLTAEQIVTILVGCLVIFVLFNTVLNLADKLDEGTPEQKALRQKRYNHEMRHMENLVYHTAYVDGSISEERIFQLIPQMRCCERCRNNLQLLFQFARTKKEIVVDAVTGLLNISPHIQKVRKHAGFFYKEGLSDIFPHWKITFHHSAYHAPF